MPYRAGFIFIITVQPAINLKFPGIWVFHGLLSLIFTLSASGATLSAEEKQRRELFLRSQKSRIDHSQSYRTLPSKPRRAQRQPKAVSHPILGSLHLSANLFNAHPIIHRAGAHILKLQGNKATRTPQPLIHQLGCGQNRSCP